MYFPFTVRLVFTWRRACLTLIRNALRTLILASTFTSPQTPAPQEPTILTPGAIRKSLGTHASMDRIIVMTPSCIPVPWQVSCFTWTRCKIQVDGLTETLFYMYVLWVFFFILVRGICMYSCVTCVYQNEEMNLDAFSIHFLDNVTIMNLFL